MVQKLTDRQREYLDFIRNFIQENESAPRLDEIAEHLGVTSSTAHKALRTLQDKGKLFFNRDRITGFYIRAPDRINTTAPFYEVNLVGKVDRYGGIFDFPEKFGHFLTTIPGSKQEDVFAVKLWQHIPSESMQAMDIIFFDQERTPQPDQIGIIPWGKRWFLVRLYALRIDDNLPFYPLLEDEEDDWMELVKEMEGYLFWWPLAYSDKTDEYFARMAVDLKVPWRPIPIDHILAIAVRLDRPLTF